MASVTRWLAARLALFVEHVIIPLGMPLVLRGWLPDVLLRVGVRAVARARLDECAAASGGDVAAETAGTRAFVEDLRRQPIAIATRDANAQHYDVPPEFFKQVKPSLASCPEPTLLFAYSRAPLHMRTGARAGHGARGTSTKTAAQVMGARMKYSATIWPRRAMSLTGVARTCPSLCLCHTAHISLNACMMHAHTHKQPHAYTHTHKHTHTV
jgi:hypothetical protein